MQVRMFYTKKDKLMLFFMFLILALFCLFVLVPLVYVIIASFIDPVVLTNQGKDDCNAENLVIGGSVNGVNVVKLAGKTLTEEGQCKINVNNVKGGQTRTGRLYLTVRLADGSTQTIYSNTWSQLNTPAE